jgi:glycosyltransferase involved in cell wall biosynthesis
MSKAPVSVIVLTFNEEVNIRACLESVKDLTAEIFIVDSFSTDRTLDIAREYTDKIYQNAWVHGAAQRQWAIKSLPVKYRWIFFLDADEQMTEALKAEIAEVIQKENENPTHGGYYVPRKFIFLRKHIRWGICKCGLKELRLCYIDTLEIKERAGFEIYKSNKKVNSLRQLLIHEDHKPLSAWIDRHNRYSSSEAEYLWNIKNKDNDLFNDINSVTTDRYLLWKETIREKIWHKLPIGFRPFLLFNYFYIFKLGFLDGRVGFIYHFLHAFWYQLLIDAKLLELRRSNSLKNSV